jgi:hypothetical protein
MGVFECGEGVVIRHCVMPDYSTTPGKLKLKGRREWSAKRLASRQLKNGRFAVLQGQVIVAWQFIFQEPRQRDSVRRERYDWFSKHDGLRK